MTWAGAYVSLAERIREQFRLPSFATAPLHISPTNEKSPSDSPTAPLFRRVLDTLGKDKRINDGRAAARELQSQPLPSESLEQALCDCRNNFSVEDQARLRLIIIGGTKRLDSAVREQIYLIAREALSNAMRHSGARWVEVELEYLRRKLRVVIRDNGRGIDPKFLRQAPHSGMSTMRDKAASIGGKMRVWSRPGKGTEVEISVPLAAENRAHFDAVRSE
jgi:nitrate/nitrite-specific signal transduction histidine kinase